MQTDRTGGLQAPQMVCCLPPSTGRGAAQLITPTLHAPSLYLGDDGEGVPRLESQANESAMPLPLGVQMLKNKLEYKIHISKAIADRSMKH